MIASYAGIVVFTIIALIFALAPLFVARFARDERPVSETTSPSRRGIAARFTSGDVTTERFLTTLVWTLLGMGILVLVPWAFAFDSLVMLTAIEMVVALVVVGVGILYAWRKGLLKSHSSVVVPAEPTE